MDPEKTDPEEIMRKTKLAQKAAGRKMAKSLAEVHESLLGSGLKPDGSAQKPNVKSWEKRKRGKPPLVHTGLLKSSSRQKIRTSKNDVALAPPKERGFVLEILKKKGYLTIYHELPRGAEKEDQRILDEELKKRGIE